MNPLRALLPLAGLVLLASPPATAQFLYNYPAANAGNTGPGAGVDLARHTLNYADSRCNDGSPAVAYVQRGSGGNANNWVIFLEGGGSCDNPQECMDRWQSYGTSYGMQKMSTRIAVTDWEAGAVGRPAPAGWVRVGNDYMVPKGIAGNGILSNALPNPFAGWTKVYANYCSSDQWAGTRAALATGAVNRSTGAAVPYTIAFRGANIFDRLVQDLRAGAINACACVENPATGQCITAQVCQALPSLTAANFVLLAGSSAGGVGVLHNLDRFRAQQSGLNPMTQVRGVFDGSSTPPRQSLPWPTTVVPGIGYTSYQAMIDDKWLNTLQAMWSARVDDTCPSQNVGVESRCADHSHVLRHHITSPFFVRQDQLDSLILQTWNLFFPVPPYPAGTGAMDQSTRTADHLTEIGSMLALLTPRYPLEQAAIVGDGQWLSPALFGPRCGNHTGLTSANTWALQELPLGGVATNLANALFGWVTTVPAGYAGPAGPLMLAPVGATIIPGPPCN
jgi:hypothetical protein